MLLNCSYIAIAVAYSYVILWTFLAMYRENFYHKFLKIFRGNIPEKFHYFSGNFRKNSAGNFRTPNHMM